MSIGKSSEMKLVMGDFNAKFGDGKYSQTMGSHGLGDRNEREGKFVEWC